MLFITVGAGGEEFIHFFHKFFTSLLSIYLGKY